jgi:hypothetical protein
MSSPKHVLRFVGAIAVIMPAVLVGGCAVPFPIQVTSWVLDGISVLATERTITDHGLSLVAQEDCSVWRGVTRGELCTVGVEPVLLVSFRNMNKIQDAQPQTELEFADAEAIAAFETAAQGSQDTVSDVPQRVE